MIRFRMALHSSATLGVLLILGLTLAACGGSGGDDNTPVLVAVPTTVRTATPRPAPDSATGDASANAVRHVTGTQMGKGAAFGLTWTPDSTGLIITGTQGGWRYDIASETFSRESSTSLPDWFGDVRFSPGGAYALARDETGNLNLWNAATGERLFSLEDEGERLLDAAFAPDDARLAALVYDDLSAAGSTTLGLGGRPPSHGLRVWTLPNGAVNDVRLEDKRILAFGFTPDGTLLAAGSDDNLPYVEGNSNMYVWPEPEYNSADFTVRFWDLDANKQIAMLDPVDGPVYTGRFDAATAHFAGQMVINLNRSGFRGPVQVWSMADLEAEPLSIATARNTWPVDFAFNPAGTQFVINYEELQSWDPTWTGSIPLWDVAGSDDPAMNLTDETIAGQLQNLAFSPDGAYIAALSTGSRIVLWDAASGERLLTSPQFTTMQLSVAFSADGQTLYSGGQDGQVITWDPATGEPVSAFNTENRSIPSIVGLPDNTLMVLYPPNDSFLHYDATTGERAEGFGQARYLGVDANHTLMALSSGGGTVRLQGLSPNDMSGVIMAGRQVVSLALSPDATVLATGSTDGMIEFWDIAARQSMGTLHGHSGAVTDLLFRADGRQLISASRNVVHQADSYNANLSNGAGDGTLRVWYLPESPPDYAQANSDVITLVSNDFSANPSSAAEIEELENYPAHPDHQATAFNDDATLFAAEIAGEATPRIVVQDMQNGDVIVVLSGPEDYITNLAFSPDSTQIVAASSDGTLWRWDLQAESE